MPWGRNPSKGAPLRPAAQEGENIQGDFEFRIGFRKLLPGFLVTLVPVSLGRPQKSTPCACEFPIRGSLPGRCIGRGEPAPNPGAVTNYMGRSAVMYPRSGKGIGPARSAFSWKDRRLKSWVSFW